MATHNHVIAQCQWHTQFDDQSNSVRLQDAISQWSQQVLPTLIGEFFDKYCPTTQIWRIDTLALDLGSITLDGLDQQLPQRVSAALEEALASLFSQQKIQFYSAQQPNLRIMDKNGSAIGLVRWYLLHGTVPWWDAGHISPLTSVDQQFSDQPNAMAKLLRDVGQKESVRRRIVWQWGEQRTRRSVQVLEPWNANFICSYADNLVQAQQQATHTQTVGRAAPLSSSFPAQNDRTFKTQLWYWILTHLLVERGSLFNTQQFVRATLWQMAQHYQLDFTELLSQLSQVAEQMQASGLVAPQFLQVLVTLQHQETAQHSSHLGASQAPDLWELLQRLLHNRQASQSTAELLQKSGVAASTDPSTTDVLNAQTSVHISELFVRLAQLDTSRTARILKQEGASDAVREYLIEQFDTEQLGLLVEVIAPQDQRFILTHVHHTQSLLRAQRIQPTLIWQVLLAYLLVNTGSYFNRRQFVQVTLQDISRKQRIDYPFLLALLIQAPVQKQINGQHFELLTILQELQKQQDPKALQHYANWQQLSEYLLHGNLRSNSRENLNSHSHPSISGSTQSADSFFTATQSPTQWHSALRAISKIQPAHSPKSLLNLLKQHVLPKVNQQQLAKRFIHALAATGSVNVSELRQLFSTLSPQHGARSLQVLQHFLEWQRQGRLPQLSSTNAIQQLSIVLVQTLLQSIAPTRSASQWLTILYQTLSRQLGNSYVELVLQIQCNVEHDVYHAQIDNQLARLLQTETVNEQQLLTSYVHIYQAELEPAASQTENTIQAPKSLQESQLLATNKASAQTKNEHGSSEQFQTAHSYTERLRIDAERHKPEQVESTIEGSTAIDAVSTLTNELPLNEQMPADDSVHDVGESRVLHNSQVIHDSRVIDKKQGSTASETATPPKTATPSITNSHAEHACTDASIKTFAEVLAKRSKPQSLETTQYDLQPENGLTVPTANTGSNVVKKAIQATLAAAQALASQSESARFQRVGELVAELLNRRVWQWRAAALQSTAHTVNYVIDLLLQGLTEPQQWHYLQLFYAGLFGRVYAGLLGRGLERYIERESEHGGNAVGGATQSANTEQLAAATLSAIQGKAQQQALQREVITTLSVQLARVFAASPLTQTIVQSPVQFQQKQPVVYAVWQQLLKQHHAAQLLEVLASNPQGQQWLAAFLPREWQQPKQRQQLLYQLQHLLSEALTLLPAHSKSMLLAQGKPVAEQLKTQIQRILWQRWTIAWQQTSSGNLPKTPESQAHWLAECLLQWAVQQQVSQIALAEAFQQSLRSEWARQLFGQNVAQTLLQHFKTLSRSSSFGEGVPSGQSTLSSKVSALSNGSVGEQSTENLPSANPHPLAKHGLPLGQQPTIRLQNPETTAKKHTASPQNDDTPQVNSDVAQSNSHDRAVNNGDHRNDDHSNDAHTKAVAEDVTVKAAKPWQQDTAARYLDQQGFDALMQRWLTEGTLPFSETLMAGMTGEVSANGIHDSQRSDQSAENSRVTVKTPSFSVLRMFADVLRFKPQRFASVISPIYHQTAVQTRLQQHITFVQVLDAVTTLHVIPTAESNHLKSVQTLLMHLRLDGISVREKQHWLMRILLDAWFTERWQLLNPTELLQQLTWQMLNSGGCSQSQLIQALQQPNLPGNQQVLQAIETVIQQLKTAACSAAESVLIDASQSPSTAHSSAADSSTHGQVSAADQRSNPVDSHSAKNTDTRSPNREQIQQQLQQVVQAERDRIAIETAEPVEFPIAITNAGIALIQSFMRPLFERLKLTENDKFISPNTQRAAVHYLQFLATGQSHTEEHHLLFNKLLCGLPPTHPIEAGVDITSAEIDTIHSLVDAVTNYWNAIGRTSVDGFRGNWIVRNGTLTEAQDHWDLIVEKRAYDVLINRSPLSYSVIKLPWMNKPIYVTWPT